MGGYGRFFSKNCGYGVQYVVKNVDLYQQVLVNFSRCSVLSPVTQNLYHCECFLTTFFQLTSTADPLFYKSDLVGNRINPHEGNREIDEHLNLNLNGEKKRRPHMGYRSVDDRKMPTTKTTTTVDPTMTTFEDLTSTDQIPVFDVSEYDDEEEDDVLPTTVASPSTIKTSIVKTSISVEEPEMGVERPEVVPTSEMDIDDHHDYGTGMTTEYEFDEGGNETTSEYFDVEDQEKMTTTTSETENMVQGFVVGTSESENSTDESISDELFGNKDLDVINSVEEMFSFQSQENATELSTDNSTEIITTESSKELSDLEPKTDESSKEEVDSEPLDSSLDEDSIRLDILPTEKFQISTNLNMTKSINLTYTEDEMNEIEVLFGEVVNTEGLTQNKTELFSSSGFQLKENRNVFAAIAIVIFLMR